MFVVATFQLNYVQYVFNCLLSKNFTSYLCLITKLLNIGNAIIFLFLCIPNLLIHCNDTETKPGPKYSSLTFCHWNLNGLKAHDSIKISLLQAHMTQHNYEITCQSETFLNSSIQSDDHRLTIDGYNLIRADHLSDSKKGGVCIYLFVINSIYL